MSGSVNKVILIGNLGKDVEIRTTQDGREIANLSVATAESWKDKSSGEKKEKTEWHRVVIFNEGLVKVAKNYLKKGSKVYLEGQLQTRKWTDQSGTEKYSTEVVLAAFGGTLVMLGSPNGGEDRQPQKPQPAPRNDEVDDEIPFSWVIACALGSSMLLMQSLGAIPFV